MLEHVITKYLNFIFKNMEKFFYCEIPNRKIELDTLLNFCNILCFEFGSIEPCLMHLKDFHNFGFKYR
jgi:hypothetical protein